MYNSHMALSKAGQILGRRLKNDGLTQEWLVEQFLGKITQQAVSTWLRGKAKPEPENRDRIAALFPECAPPEWDVAADAADESGEHSAAPSSPDLTGTG